MEVWDTSLDGIGSLLVEIALRRAREVAAESGQADAAYVDTGLTPGQLREICLARWLEQWGWKQAADVSGTMVERADDRRLQEGMFRFFVTVQEALGRLFILDAGAGERHVFVARGFLMTHGNMAATAVGAQA